jgi:hypothetical protein
MKVHGVKWHQAKWHGVVGLTTPLSSWGRWVGYDS